MILQYNNWTIERSFNGEEIEWSVKHRSSDTPYLLYDLDLEEVKQWIDEKNEQAKEFNV